MEKQMDSTVQEMNSAATGEQLVTTGSIPFFENVMDEIAGTLFHAGYDGSEATSEEKQYLEADLYEVWITPDGNAHWRKHHCHKRPYCAWAFSQFYTRCGATVMENKYMDKLHVSNVLKVNEEDMGWFSPGILARCITRDPNIQKTVDLLREEIGRTYGQYILDSNKRIADFAWLVRTPSKIGLEISEEPPRVRTEE